MNDKKRRKVRIRGLWIQLSTKQRTTLEALLTGLLSPATGNTVADVCPKCQRELNDPHCIRDHHERELEAILDLVRAS